MNLPIGWEWMIEEETKGDWHFLTKRADIPPLPVWIKIKFSSESEKFAELYGARVPWVNFWHDNEAEFYLRNFEFRKVFEEVTHLLYSPKAVRGHLQKVEKYCRLAAERARVFYDGESLGKLDNAGLAKNYENIIQYYGQAFIYGFFTWCSKVAQENARSIIARREDALLALNLDTDSALGVLIRSRSETAYNKKEHALNHLADEYKSILAGNSLTEKEISEKFPKLDKDVKSFLDDFKWVGYDYNGPVMSYGEVIGAIKEKETKTEDKATRERIIEVGDFSADELEIFEVLAMVAHAKDVRNIADDYIHFCFDNLYAEVGKRFSLTRKQVKFLWPEEMSALLEGKTKIVQDHVEKKMEYCAAVTISERLGLKNYYTGAEAKKLRDNIVAAPSSEVTDKNEDAVKGMVASVGKATGRVKIVYSFADVDKVEKGDILVALMTSPRFMPAIIRCGAIVTNDGGLTCHAAIIARELKKPCIIGTKIATEVLKDGDMVEVDADKGIVRKIK